MEPTYLRLQALRKPIFLNPSSISATNLGHFHFPHCQPSHRISCTNGGSSSSSTSNDNIPPPTPPITPPETVEIRFRRGARKKRKAREEALQQANAAAKEAPKKWEDMSVAEKVLELYVGEKGLLFWLNKFAYASIFIIIGAWILFRFVGPALNLYQLDAPPLPPSSILKS